MKEVKTEVLRMRLTPNEKAELRSLAAVHKVTMSRYFKSVMFYSKENVSFAQQS